MKMIEISNLRAAREAKGWSLAELAKRTGVHYTSLGRAERGERNLLASNYVRVARALGTTVDALLEDDQ